MDREDCYGSCADSDSDGIGRPIDSSINFLVRSSSDCSSSKHGRGNSRRVGAIAMSACNLAMKIGINEVRNAGAAVAMGTPKELS